MGMNAITCKGYADVKESGFGKGTRTSSDFDGNDILKGAALTALLAAGTLIAGCIDERAPPTKDAVKYEKNPDYMVPGKVIDDSEKWTTSFSGYAIRTDKTLNVGQPVVLHRLEGNVVLNDSFNVCRVRNGEILDPGYYILKCENIRHDGIEIGDTVAVYQALEMNK